MGCSLQAMMCMAGFAPAIPRIPRFKLVARAHEQSLHLDDTAIESDIDDPTTLPKEQVETLIRVRVNGKRDACPDADCTCSSLSTTAKTCGTDRPRSIANQACQTHL